MACRRVAREPALQQAEWQRGGGGGHTERERRQRPAKHTKPYARRSCVGVRARSLIVSGGVLVHAHRVGARHHHLHQRLHAALGGRRRHHAGLRHAAVGRPDRVWASGGSRCRGRRGRWGRGQLGPVGGGALQQATAARRARGRNGGARLGHGQRVAAHALHVGSEGSWWSGGGAPQARAPALAAAGFAPLPRRPASRSTRTPLAPGRPRTCQSHSS